jgi:hypothetical protein
LSPRRPRRAVYEALRAEHVADAIEVDDDGHASEAQPLQLAAISPALGPVLIKVSYLLSKHRRHRTPPLSQRYMTTLSVVLPQIKHAGITKRTYGASRRTFIQVIGLGSEFLLAPRSLRMAALVIVLAS